jgi:hypothetical protein
MFEKAKSGRDAFTFSLHGMTTIASFTPAPAIADDQINNAIDDSFGRGPGRDSDVIRAIEDFLARYYAPGCCRAA